MRANEFNFTTNITRFNDLKHSEGFNKFTAQGTHPATSQGTETMTFDENGSYVTFPNESGRPDNPPPSPTTYITHVDLYDVAGFRVATAKLSKPIKKDFNSEVIIKIHLKVV